MPIFQEHSEDFSKSSEKTHQTTKVVNFLTIFQLFDQFLVGLYLKIQLVEILKLILKTINEVPQHFKKFFLMI